jgi:hypothetical protein
MGCRRRCRPGGEALPGRRWARAEGGDDAEGRRLLVAGAGAGVNAGAEMVPPCQWAAMQGHMAVVLRQSGRALMLGTGGGETWGSCCDCCPGGRRGATLAGAMRLASDSVHWRSCRSMAGSGWRIGQHLGGSPRGECRRLHDVDCSTHTRARVRDETFITCAAVSVVCVAACLMDHHSRTVCGDVWLPPVAIGIMSWGLRRQVPVDACSTQPGRCGPAAPRGCMHSDDAHLLALFCSGQGASMCQWTNFRVSLLFLVGCHLDTQVIDTSVLRSAQLVALSLGCHGLGRGATASSGTHGLCRTPEAALTTALV